MANRPAVQYRYHAISDFRQEIEPLHHHRTWFASLRTLNDPFECRPKFVFSKNAELEEASALMAVRNNAPAYTGEVERAAHVQRILENSRDPEFVPLIKDQFRTAMQEILDGNSMKSFSSNRDSLLQWAYYAGAHTG